MSSSALTLSETRGRLERARAQVRSMKAEGARVTRLATHTTLASGGGAVAGYLKVKRPTVRIAGTQVNTAVGLGLVATLAASLDFAGDYSDELQAIGSGMLAKAAGDAVERNLMTP